MPVETTLYRPESGELVFIHQTENGEGAALDTFRGYDLFYKLYANTVDLASDVEEDINFIDDTPREPGTSRLLARDFVQVYPRESPLIAVSPTADAIEITIDVISPPIGENKDMTVSWGGGPTIVPIRRASSDDSGGAQPIEFNDAEPFWSDDRYTSTDYDVQKMIESLPDAPDSIAIVFAVVAYGVDGTFKPIYSEPTIVYKEVILDI